MPHVSWAGSATLQRMLVCLLTVAALRTPLYMLHQQDYPQSGAHKLDMMTFKFEPYAAPGCCRLIRTDIQTPSDPSTWPDVIPEHSSNLLQWAAALKASLLFPQTPVRWLNVLLTSPAVVL